MNLIGITGYAGTGKSTVADLIKYQCVRQGRSCIIYSISSVIKQAFSDATGMSLKDIEDRKRTHPLVRYYLQVTGDWMNEHCQPLIEKLNMYLVEMSNNNKVDVLIIPDVRYPEEAKLIHKYGGKVVRITRPGFEGVNKHPTETEVLKVISDYTVYNDKGMTWLEKESVLLLDMFGGNKPA